MAKMKSDEQVAMDVLRQIKDERRYKLAYVSGDSILELLARGIGKPIVDGETIIKGVPDNAVLLGIDYEIEYAAFVFLIGSLDFDTVPEGERPEGLTLYVRRAI